MSSAGAATPYRVLVLAVVWFCLALATSCGAEDQAVDCAGRRDGSDMLALDGEGLFAAAFSEARCEAQLIGVEDLISEGSLAIIAPSPGFTDQELIDLATSLLEPAGLETSAIQFYILATDRVTVARLPGSGPMSTALVRATGILRDTFSEDGRTGAENRLAFVVEADVGNSDPARLDQVLHSLWDNGYALVIGKDVSFPPPFDPARDRSSAEYRG